MSLALTQQTRFAISKKKQVDLVTALTAADMLSLTGTAIDFHATPVNEDNATDLGKGVYATNVFPVSWDTGGTWNGFLTSEAMAVISAFGVGAVVETTVATGGFKITMVAPQLETTGLDLPVASVVQTIGAVVDKLLIGMACEEFGLQLKSGSGRQNAQFTSSWLGTGKNTDPSGITMPAAFSEHGLNAGGITSLTLIGFDYLANHRFSTCDFNWKNNIRDGSSYFPGSGSQGGYQLRGRVRRGVPTLTLKATVEADSGSNEEDALLSQTEGTGVITVVGPTFAGGGGAHTYKLTFQRLRVKTSPITDLDGISGFSVDYSILQHPTNGVLTIEATTETTGILS